MSKQIQDLLSTYNITLLTQADCEDYAKHSFENSKDLIQTAFFVLADLLTNKTIPDFIKQEQEQMLNTIIKIGFASIMAYHYNHFSSMFIQDYQRKIGTGDYWMEIELLSKVFEKKRDYELAKKEKIEASANLVHWIQSKIQSSEKCNEEQD